MASKLLTETLTQIFSELKLDDLFSCALVNREWCQIAVPILWSNPWKKFNCNLIDEKYMLLISTYISCLSEDDRNILNSSDVLSSDLTRRIPSFDYPIFLRCLNYHHFIFLINKFISVKVGDNENLTKYIIIKLWNLFKERCRRLVHFGISNHYGNNFLHFYLILLDNLGSESTNMLANISSFQCEGNIQSSLLYKLANICKLIREITINNLSQDNDGIAYLIKSQKSIRKLFLEFFYDAPNYGFTKIANVLKDIDSLNHLILSGRFPLSLSNVFSKCSGLQKLELLLNEGNIGMEGFVTNRFPELRDLKISFNEVSARQLSLLINNTQGKIEKLFILGREIIDPENSFILSESIINKCVNLREFVIYIEPIGSILPPLPKLFQQCIHLETIMIIGNIINGSYHFGEDLIEAVPYIPKNFKYVFTPINFYSNETLKKFGELVMEKQVFKVSTYENLSESTRTIFFNKSFGIK